VTGTAWRGGRWRTGGGRDRSFRGHIRPYVTWFELPTSVCEFGKKSREGSGCNVKEKLKYRYRLPSNRVSGRWIFTHRTTDHHTVWHVLANTTYSIHT